MRFVRIPKPSFALQAFDSTEKPNEKGEYDYRVPGYLYDLTKESNVPMGADFNTALSQVTDFIRSSNIKMLKTLVINSHGSPGFIYLGNGVDEKNVFLFSQLKGLVKKIYLTGCNIAEGGKGIEFCLSIAKHSGAIVFASDQLQERVVNEKYPVNKIDLFEGDVFRFKPNGGFRRSLRLSNYEDEDLEINRF